MKNLIKTCLCGVLLLAANIAAKAQYGSICGDPAQKECAGQYEGFAPQDLIFNTGRAELGTGTRHESDEFYAVILESVAARKTGGANCNFVSEAKRRLAQKLFPHNKVFASRNVCQSIVLYDNTQDDFNFMAIYAGADEQSASATLAKAKKKYPSANIRKMKVILDFADE